MRRSSGMSPQRMSGTEGDHTRNGASMKTCDKTLATIPTLRDNAVVGPLHTVAGRWQAPQKTHGSPGIVATWNRGRLLTQVWVLQSRRPRCEPGNPQVHARRSPASGGAMMAEIRAQTVHARGALHAHCRLASPYPGKRYADQSGAPTDFPFFKGRSATGNGGCGRRCGRHPSAGWDPNSNEVAVEAARQHPTGSRCWGTSPSIARRAAR
jgi:hypothetical protein